MLQFPYLEHLLSGLTPPSMPSAARVRHRPLVPITILGRTDSRTFHRALLDTGADDCIFPEKIMRQIGANPIADSSFRIRWRGQPYPLTFAGVELEIADDSGVCRWPTVVVFSPAPMPFPILGNAGCLEFFDCRFLGADHLIELEANWRYPGTR